MAALVSLSLSANNQAPQCRKHINVACSNMLEIENSCEHQALAKPQLISLHAHRHRAHQAGQNVIKQRIP